MNSMYFNREDVENGVLDKFIKELISQGNNSSKYYNDIHIYNEEDAVIVEWVQRHYDVYGEADDRFEFIESDQVIMTEFMYPDRSIGYIIPGTENEEFEKWSKEHPGWHKTSYGTWVNDEENEKLKKELETAEVKDEDDGWHHIQLQ